MAQLRNVVSRPIGFDAVLRVRCSAGIRACDFLGNFVATNSNDLEMAAIDSDKTLIAEIKYTTGHNLVVVHCTIVRKLCYCKLTVVQYSVLDTLL